MRLLFIVICFSFIHHSFAQEMQIPLLPEKSILTVNSEINQQFELFPEYEQFVSARLFKKSDSSFVLQILFRKDNAYYQIRKPLTAHELTQLRNQLLQKMRSKKFAQNQQGRIKLLVASTGLALGYYGWVLPEALSVNSDKLGVALYMFTGSAGFFVPYLVTKERPVSTAAAHLAIYGASRGILHGIFVPMLLSPHPGEKSILMSTIGTSIVEGTAGYMIATHYKLGTSTVETAMVGGDFGAIIGTQFALMMGFFDDDNGRQRSSASILAGSALGLAGGWYLTTKQPYSRGNARVLESVALLGGYIPLAIADLANSKDEKVWAGASLAGTLLGFGYGHRLLNNKNFSFQHGLFIELSTLSGGLLAAGFAYLIAPENEVDLSKIIFTSSALGAVAGFYLMYKNFVNVSLRKNSNFSVNVNFSPLGILSLRHSNQSRFTPPLFQAQIRF